MFDIGMLHREGSSSEDKSRDERTHISVDTCANILFRSFIDVQDNRLLVDSSFLRIHLFPDHHPFRQTPLSCQLSPCPKN